MNSIKLPDMKNAQSIIESAKREMKFTLTLKINEESGSTIIRNIYECFRKLGDAVLTSKGIRAHDHIEPLKEIMNLKIKTSRPLGIIENLRRLRHNINYYGYLPNLAEVKYAVEIAKSLFDSVYREVNGLIKS